MKQNKQSSDHQNSHQISNAGGWSGAVRDAMPEDWGVLLGASAAAYGIGMLSLLVLPFLIGITMTLAGLE